MSTVLKQHSSKLHLLVIAIASGTASLGCRLLTSWYARRGIDASVRCAAHGPLIGNVTVAPNPEFSPPYAVA